MSSKRHSAKKLSKNPKKTGVKKCAPRTLTPEQRQRAALDKAFTFTQNLGRSTRPCSGHCQPPKMENPLCLDEATIKRINETVNRALDAIDFATATMNQQVHAVQAEIQKPIQENEKQKKSNDFDSLLRAFGINPQN